MKTIRNLSVFLLVLLVAFGAVSVSTYAQESDPWETFDPTYDYNGDGVVDDPDGFMTPDKMAFSAHQYGNTPDTSQPDPVLPDGPGHWEEIECPVADGENLCDKYACSVDENGAKYYLDENSNRIYVATTTGSKKGCMTWVVDDPTPTTSPTSPVVPSDAGYTIQNRTDSPVSYRDDTVDNSKAVQYTASTGVQEVVSPTATSTPAPTATPTTTTSAPTATVIPATPTPSAVPTTTAVASPQTGASYNLMIAAVILVSASVILGILIGRKKDQEDQAEENQEVESEVEAQVEESDKPEEKSEEKSEE